MIVIDPSMGFGTGHHQTTRLCLALLQSVEVAGRRVVDVGTGSGVLALAAWRLGAAAIVAVDNDADALQNARENIERNGARRDVLAECSDLEDFETAPADIVTANLTASVLAQHAAALRRLVKPGGALIISGFSPLEMPGLAAAFGPLDVRHVVEGEWSAARDPAVSAAVARILRRASCHSGCVFQHPGRADIDAAWLTGGTRPRP